MLSIHIRDEPGPSVSHLRVVCYRLTQSWYCPGFFPNVSKCYKNKIALLINKVLMGASEWAGEMKRGWNATSSLIILYRMAII